MKRWAFYIAYIIAAVVFFLYYLFPSDAAKEVIASYLKQNQPDYQLTAAQIKPVFPPGIRLNRVEISYKNDVWLELDRLTVTPNYLSLFSPKKVFLFKGNAYQGEVSGTVALTGDAAPFEIDAAADLKQIKLSDVKHFQEVIGKKFLGDMNGVVHYQNSGGVDRKMDIRLNLSDCTVTIDHPLVAGSIDQVAFQSIDAVIAVDKQSLQLKQGKALGTQADGDLSGIMRFRRPFGKSLLDFRGTLKLHHTLLANLKDLLPQGLYQPRKTEGNGMPIRVYGTLENPKFSFR